MQKSSSPRRDPISRGPEWGDAGIERKEKDFGMGGCGKVFDRTRPNKVRLPTQQKRGEREDMDTFVRLQENQGMETIETKKNKTPPIEEKDPSIVGKIPKRIYLDRKNVILSRLPKQQEEKGGGKSKPPFAKKPIKKKKKGNFFLGGGGVARRKRGKEGHLTKKKKESGSFQGEASLFGGAEL